MLIISNDKFASNLLSHKIHGTHMLENKLNVSKHTFFVIIVMGKNKLIHECICRRKTRIFPHLFAALKVCDPPRPIMWGPLPKAHVPQKKNAFLLLAFCQTYASICTCFTKSDTTAVKCYTTPSKSNLFEPKDGGLVHMLFRFQPFIFRGVHCRLQMLHLYGCNMKSIGSIKDSSSGWGPK